jgi:hypothetical protein
LPLFNASSSEVADRHDVHAVRGAGLGQEHGAELAGADDADRHRAPLGLPLEQHRMQIHDDPRLGVSSLLEHDHFSEGETSLSDNRFVPL